LTTFLPRLDVEQLQESTLFFLAESVETEGATLDLMAKYFLTTEPLIKKIVRHPRVLSATLNYIRLFGPASILASDVFPSSNVKETLSDPEILQKRVAEIEHLRIPEKIQLALKGNREARLLLLRDPNRQVALAVLSSPKLTDEEVEIVAESRNVSEEVLRTVARNAAWTRRYAVREALTRNPKTPLSFSMTFLKGLRQQDMTRLAKDKGVPAAIRTTAAKMLAIKRV
jgi:hypothetical protein